jgi:hypothetical protein
VNIKELRNINSIGNNNVNVMNLFNPSQGISSSHGSSNCHRLKIKQVKPFPPSEKCDCLLSSKRTVRYEIHLHQPLYT